MEKDVDSVEVEKTKELLESLCKNEIFIDTKEDSDVKPNSSKIGGKPWLPKDFIWPTFTSYDDNVTRPLSFFCQINLEEIKEFDIDNVLPKKGMLYFFYECESFTWGFDSRDKGAARVFYYENTEGFISFHIPNVIDKMYVIPELGIDVCSRKSYPSIDEIDEHTDTFCDYDIYEEAMCDIDYDEEEEHKLLGYANTIQNEMLTECERASRGLSSSNPDAYAATGDSVRKEIEECKREWTLLLQLGTITKGDFEFMFGDCGRIYFYIRKSDLENKNFDNVQFCVQCS